MAGASTGLTWNSGRENRLNALLVSDDEEDDTIDDEAEESSSSNTSRVTRSRRGVEPANNAPTNAPTIRYPMRPSMIQNSRVLHFGPAYSFANIVEHHLKPELQRIVMETERETRGNMRKMSKPDNWQTAFMQPRGTRGQIPGDDPALDYATFTSEQFSEAFTHRLIQDLVIGPENARIATQDLLRFLIEELPGNPPRCLAAFDGKFLSASEYKNCNQVLWNGFCTKSSGPDKKFVEQVMEYWQIGLELKEDLSVTALKACCLCRAMPSASWHVHARTHLIQGLRYECRGKLGDGIRCNANFEEKAEFEEHMMKVHPE